MIDELYKSQQGYWYLYGKDVVITSIIITSVLLLVGYSNFKTAIEEVRTNWSLNRCNPIYIPFAGYIMPEPGKTSADITFSNFNYCLKQDVSTVISIAMMPFEFFMYMIVEMLDVILDSIMAGMAFLAYLRTMLGEIFANVYNSILGFVVPILEIVSKLRDALAKTNAIIVSALFTSMTLYDIVVSGILNVMHILNVIMIALGVTILAMLIFAALMIAFGPFTIAIGMTTFIAATSVIVCIIIPVITIYTIMLVFILEISHVVAENAPSVPSTKKKK